MSDPLRVYYNPGEIDRYGYPFAWSEETIAEEQNGLPNDGPILNIPIKDLIRERDDHRCLRCGHPYRKGENGNGQWSSCDENCTHRGPIRTWSNPPGMELLPGLTFTPETVSAGEIVTQFARVDAEWRILTVHHLNGVKHDCRWWNLVSLCQRCHLTIQGKVIMNRVWPWEHSTWFKQFAAGWYAWVYEDREITREEADERMEELLAYERRV